MNTTSILRGLGLGIALLALPAAAHAADGFARTSGTLRAGAGSDYPAVMRISAGTELDVIGCISRYTWCDVAVDGERGWFPGRRIGIVRDGRRAYLSDGGAGLGLTILSFGMADYWGSHYAERPWYNERRWWRGRGDMPRPHATPYGGNGNPVPRGTPPGYTTPRVHVQPPADVTPTVRGVEPRQRPVGRTLGDPGTRAQRPVQHDRPMMNSGQAPTPRTGRAGPQGGGQGVLEPQQPPPR